MATSDEARHCRQVARERRLRAEDAVTKERDEAQASAPHPGSGECDFCGSAPALGVALCETCRGVVEKHAAEPAPWWGVWVSNDLDPTFKGWWWDVRSGEQVSSEPLQTTETEARRTADALMENQATRTDSLGWRYTAKSYLPEQKGDEEEGVEELLTQAVALCEKIGLSKPDSRFPDNPRAAFQSAALKCAWAIRQLLKDRKTP